MTKDSESFFELIMRESNQLHAVCMDTYPSINYLNSTSHHIHSLVQAINQEGSKAKVAYSNDAGAHVFLFCDKRNVNNVRKRLEKEPFYKDIENIIETSIDPTGVELI